MGEKLFNKPALVIYRTTFPGSEEHKNALLLQNSIKNYIIVAINTKILHKISKLQTGMLFAYINNMVSLKIKVEDIEKEEIIKALKNCDWVKVRAAKYLGITERMIGYKIKKYRIKKKREQTIVNSYHWRTDE